MDDSILIVIAIIGMLTLSLGLVFFVFLYQRRVINHQIQLRDFNRQKELELMQASIRSEEDERMRIATELHDDVGATLSSVRLFLHQALRNPEDAALAAQTKELLDEGIRKVRDLSHQLQPGTLQYLGLVKAFQSLAEIITRSGAIQMEMIPEVDPWPEPDEQTALSLYRVIQELVNNTIKHAQASGIRLTTSTYDGNYCITLSHNGKGLTEMAYREQLFKKEAIGLKNIEQRLKSANLSITFIEEMDGIYTVRLCLPARSA